MALDMYESGRHNTHFLPRMPPLHPLHLTCLQGLMGKADHMVDGTFAQDQTHFTAATPVYIEIYRINF